MKMLLSVVLGSWNGMPTCECEVCLIGPAH